MKQNITERCKRLLAVMLTVALLLGNLSPVFAVSAETTPGDTQATGDAQSTEPTQETVPVTEPTHQTTAATEPSQSTISVTQTMPPQADNSGVMYASVPESTTDGIDLYVHNGGEVTLLGGGNYTAQNGSYSVGETTYKLHVTQALTQLTTVTVAEGIEATVILTNVNVANMLNIVLKAGAKVQLTVSGNCNIAAVTLETGAALSVSGGTLDLGSVTGGGSTALTLGEGNVVLGDNVNVANITLNQTMLSGGSIRATTKIGMSNVILSAMTDIISSGDLTISRSSVTARKVGIQGGSGTVTMSGSGSVTAEIVGALDQESIAYLGARELTVSGTEYWDYTITYQDYDTEGYKVCTPEGAAIGFRKMQNGANKTIVGYRTSAGAFIEASEVPLAAQLSRENYEFRGWSAAQMGSDADEASDKTNAQWLAYDGKTWNTTENKIEDAGAPAYASAVIGADSENVTVYAVYVPKSMVVELHTNLAEDTVYAYFPAYVGAAGENLQQYFNEETYPVLKQEGRQINTFADAPTDGSAVNVVGFQVSAWNDTGKYALYAVWTSQVIQTSYLVTTYYPNHTYQYQNAEGQWVDIVGNDLNAVNDALAAALEEKSINYGGTYGKLPVLRLVAGTSATESYNFVGWYVVRQDDQPMVDSDTVVGEDTTSENALELGSQMLFAMFEKDRYELTVSNNGKWSFFDGNGNAIQFVDNGNGTKTAEVNSDTTVTMVRSDENTVASYWRLTNDRTSQLIWPEERASSQGGSYWLYYSFTMPQANVTAVYDETVRWDTAMGDYTFGTYTINGRESYGIRIINRATGDTRYFRWIMKNNATTAYFTSSVETDNQIVLDAATTLYLDGVKLKAREELLPNLKEFYNSGVYKGSIAVYNFAQYQNIISDNYPENEQPYNASTSYTVTINLLSDSKVFAIGQRAWINSVCNGWDKAYRTCYKINGNDHTLELYSLLYHGNSSVIDKCKLKVLTAGEEYDQTIHWYHGDTSTSSIKNSTIDAAGRILFARLGGSLTSSGNGVSFTLNKCTVVNGGTMHVPCFHVDYSDLTADYIRINYYHYQFEHSTIRAKILGFENGVHVGYANDYSILNDCNVEVDEWLSAARMKIYGGTKLKVNQGIHLFESLYIYGVGTEVEAASMGRFRTYEGNKNQDGTQYAGDNSYHYFDAEIYGGAKVNITGNWDMGVKHFSEPTIQIYGSGTEVTVGGDMDLVNMFYVNAGAKLTVGRNLTVHQDMEVKDAGTTLSVTGNLYHVTESTDDLYKTGVGSDGSAQQVYWGLYFDGQAAVSVGSNVGSQTENDRTNVVYDRATTNLQFSGSVTRDVQVSYVIPDGYTNNEGNPDNIRLVNDLYGGMDVALQNPIKTGDTVVELEENCWYDGDTNVTGWKSNAAFQAYDGFLRLQAKTTGYALTMYHDSNVISGIRYRLGEGEWSEAESIPTTGGTLRIPVGAQVQIIVPASYADLVCAESFVNGIYTPVALLVTEDADKCIISFTMTQVQIQFRALQQLQLYLDEGSIHVVEQAGKVGFARYNGAAANFVPYGGHLVVTQKNALVTCTNTLFIKRNVAADTATVTLTGIYIADNSGVAVHTVDFADNVTAAMHLRGKNAIRNIRVPSTANATILGADDAETTFVKSALFNGNYVAGDNTSYYAFIGDNNGGTITLRGGIYISYAHYNNQGNTAAFGSRVEPAKPLILENITYRYQSTNSHNPTFCRAAKQKVIVTNCTVDINTTGSVPFVCKQLEFHGGSLNYVCTVSASPVSAFISVTDSVVLSGDAMVEDSCKASGYFIFADIAGQQLTLKDTAKYITTGNLLQKSLTVQDSAVLDMSGYIIAAASIHISGGQVTCGQLLSSGYVSSQADGAVLISKHSGGTGVITGGSITITGGSVMATGGTANVVTSTDSVGVAQTLPGTIGGSRGSVLNISGGTVTADCIGESDYLFGLFRQRNYAILDQNAIGAQMEIIGGTLTADVLGGHLAELSIAQNAEITVPENGRVEGAVIKIKDNARLAMPATAVLGCDGSSITVSSTARIEGVAGAGYGVIEAKGGNLVIQDQTSVHVSRVNLKNGNIIVTTTSRNLQSTYGYKEDLTRDDDVGLFVDYGGTDAPEMSDPMGTHLGDLAAENITVGANTRISAYRIGSNAVLPRSGMLHLISSSFIASESYGAYGSGNITVTKEEGAQWIGDQLMSVNYDLDTTDPVIMPDDAVYFYYVNDSQTATLPIPERKGYRFDGWYYNNSDTKVEQINFRNADHYLKARWTPIRIWINLYEMEEMQQMSNWLSVTYGDTMVTYPNYIIRDMVTVGYIADTQWQYVFTNQLLPAGTQLNIPEKLFDAYLKANDVIYDDGLNDAEKAVLRVLENLNTKEAVLQHGELSYPKLDANWNMVQQKVTYDSGYTTITQFLYGSTVRNISQIGTGKQDIVYYSEQTYAQGYLDGTQVSNIPIPIRKGYNFVNWSNGEKKLTPGIDEATTVDSNVTYWSANYTPKTYRVYLIPEIGDKNGNLASYDGLTVDDTSGYYYFIATYDQLTGINLPDAQIVGYVHKGWDILLTRSGMEYRVSFAENAYFLWDEANSLVPQGLEKGDTDGVFVLKPNMRSTKITYQLNGGKWLDESKLPKYQAYVDQQLPKVEYDNTSGVFLIPEGKENSLKRHGYRFIGWADKVSYDSWQATNELAESYFDGTKANLLTHADVTYADVTYYAVWQPCNYNVVLRAWNTEPEKATWANAEIGGTITVEWNGGDLEAKVTQEGVVTLPENATGRLSHKSTGTEEITTRQLLGWMFSDCNPVTEYYNEDGSIKSDYAKVVTQQMNAGALFKNGESFWLPGVVDDPGDGGTIYMYAVYRERSLIFVQNTPDGEQTVLLIADYSVGRSDYTPAPEPVEIHNYRLSGWYVNSERPDPARDYQWYGLEYNVHPKYSDQNRKDGKYIIREGMTTGTYLVESYVGESDTSKQFDIYVYTYYAPTLVADMELYAQAGKYPTSSVKDTYIVPETLQVPETVKFSYQVTTTKRDANIAFVTKNVIDAWDGRDAWDVDGVTYHANNTFALELVVSKEGTTVILPLVDTVETQTQYYLTRGYNLKVNVYSTNRLKDEKQVGTVQVVFTFNGLPGASLTVNAPLYRKNATYELNMVANVPESEQYSDISGWTALDAVRQNETRFREFLFGSSVDVLPKLQLNGYTHVGWMDENGNRVRDTLDYAPAKNENSHLAQTLTAVWEKNESKVTLDSGMLENWDVSFEDANGTSVEIPLTDSSYRVPYKTKVKLTPKAGHEINGYPEFIQGIALNENGTTAIFVMPNNSVDLKFSRVKTLDVADGNITVTDNGYIQNGTEVQWRGDYCFKGQSADMVISIQTTNTPTANVVHQFTFRDLNADSVQLTQNAELTFEGETTLRCIESTGKLILSGKNNAKLNVVPDSGAAVSAGSVVVQDLTLVATLSNRHHTTASKVETKAIAAGAIELKNSTVNAVFASAIATYAGVIFDSANVKIQESNVTAKANDGCPVSGAALVGAASNVTVDNSSLESEVGIETTGTVELVNGTQMKLDERANLTAVQLTVLDTSALSALNSLVSGEQTIAATADVIDRNGRHLDTKSGAVTITATGYQQGSRSETENRTYVLVGKSDNAVSITNPANTVYLDSAQTGQIKVEGTATLKLLSQSQIGGIIGSNKAAVTIQSDSRDTVLTATGDIKSHTLTIQQCQIAASGYLVGSEGKETEGGKIGCVTLTNATVTAETVGALGKSQESFTQVKLDTSSTVEGELVQDHYRLSYELGQHPYEATGLPTVFRTTQTGHNGDQKPVAPENGYPGAPTLKPGTTEGYFLAWYILNDSDQRIALISAIPEGRTGAFEEQPSPLKAEFVNYAETVADDGSRTLKIYGYFQASGVAKIREGRWYAFGDQDGSTHVSISGNQAWTAWFVVNDSTTDTHSYTVKFTSALPADTRLILTVLGDTPRYYGYVLGEATNELNLADFAEMGTGAKPVFSGGTYSFLLAADFMDTPGEQGETELTIYSGRNKVEGSTVRFQRAAVVYQQTKVICGSQETEVLHLPASGTVALIAEFTDVDAIPYDAEMTLKAGDKEIQGQWFAGNSAVFLLNGEPEAEYVWSYSGLKNGSYTVKWYLAALTGVGINKLYTSNVSSISFTHTQEAPRMAVTMGTETFSWEQGKERTISYEVTGNVSSNVTITVEKQSSMGIYQEATTAITVADRNIVFPGTLESGTYRLCFSFDPGSTRDNVYYTFVIKTP